MKVEDEKLIVTALDYVRCGIGANYSRESFSNRMDEIYTPFSKLVNKLRTADQERDDCKAQRDELLSAFIALHNQAYFIDNDYPESNMCKSNIAIINSIKAKCEAQS